MLGVAGHELEGVLQHLNLRIVGLHEEGHHEQGILEGGTDIVRELRQCGRDFLGRDGRGPAAIHGLHEAVALFADGAAHYRERSEVLVGRGDAHAGAGGVGHEALHEFQELAFLLVAQAVLQQVVRQQHDGGDATLGPGGMGIHTRSIDARRAVAGVFHGNALGRGQRGGIGAHDGPGLAGHRVGHHAARDVQNHRVGDGRARDAPVVAALLAVAHGEVGIGREEERRALVVLEVPRHVSHGGFLVGTEQEADGIGARQVEPAQALHRMKGNHRRALVVQATAAHEVPVLFRHLEGLERPARASGHHIHVPDNAQLSVGFAGQICEADVTLAVGGGHAHPLGDLERRFQGGSGARAIGCTRCSSGQVLGRGNFHELGDVSHNSIAMSIPVCLGGGNYFLAIHSIVPFMHVVP